MVHKISFSGYVVVMMNEGKVNGIENHRISDVGKENH